ncbi:MAG: hypothetical protein QXZ41_01890 [Ignisphaera sp.]
MDRGGWRTSSKLLSPRFVDRFIWPYIVEIADRLIVEGLTPVFH